MLVARTGIVMALMAVMGVLQPNFCTPGFAAAPPGSCDSNGEAKALDGRKAKWVNLELLIPGNVVTVFYRGKTHTLSGTQAKVVRKAGLDLLKSSRRERAADNDPESLRRYAIIRNRSYVLIIFSRPLAVHRASNPKTPVKAKTLLIPFSPDLDPEAVYVMPGKPFRIFAEMNPDGFNTIRSALVGAGIYPMAVAPIKDVTTAPKYSPNRFFTRVKALYERRDYRGVCRLSKAAPLDRFKNDPKTKDNPVWVEARFMLADSYRQVATNANQSTSLTGGQLSAETRMNYQKECEQWLKQAAEEFASLDAYLATAAGKNQLTAKQRAEIPFMAARCWFNLGEFYKALAIHKRLIARYPNQKEGLDALGGAIQCHAALGEIGQLQKRLNQIQELLPKVPVDVRTAWEPWFAECIKQVKDLPPTIEE
jgi:tetratricopeptide (TPR) repeat protein